MSRLTILPLEPRALAAALKRGKKDRFYLSRVDGHTYATDGIMMVRIPADLETEILAPTMQAYPESYRADASYWKGAHKPGAPDLARLWAQHMHDNAAELPQLDDTRLTYHPATDAPGYSVYARPQGYIYLPQPYTACLTPNVRLRGEYRPDPITGASNAPVYVEWGGKIVAVIMPYQTDRPQYLADIAPTPAAQEPSEEPAA